MGKSNHFSGQPLYGQVIKLLDKSKILRFSRERGGERYIKRFNGWIHLVVMLYAVIMRFDSLREITASLLAETCKLSHLGITQCCPKRFSIKTKKGSKAKVEITTLAKSTTSFTSYGKYNTFRTSNR